MNPKLLAAGEVVIALKFALDLVDHSDEFVLGAFPASFAHAPAGFSDRLRSLGRYNPNLLLFQPR
jgi:hypothetical protein